MIDHELGTRWTEAPAYQEEWFGSVDNDVADTFRIRGRFRNVRTVLDSDLDPKTFEAGGYMNWSEPLLSPYGFINNPANVARSHWLQRSNRFCGLANTQPFPSCGHLVNCFANFSSLLEWDLCVENNVHANLHGLHGGLDHCPFDLPTVARDRLGFLSDGDKEPHHGLLSFLTANIAEEILTKYEDVFPFLVCPTSCDFDTDTFKTCHCGSTSTLTGVNLHSLTDHQVHSYISSALTKLYEGYEGEKYMYLEMRRLEPVFRDLSHNETAAIERVYLEMLAQPGTYGTFATGAAPNDPLFWPMHPIFEKAWQVLRLSSSYAHLNLTWNNEASANCEGGTGWHETLPFGDLFDGVVGMGDNGGYTNAQLWDLFTPDGDTIPYVYDQFSNWGSCDWAPLA